jgi:hypothetical protein
MFENKAICHKLSGYGSVILNHAQIAKELAELGKYVSLLAI